MYLQSPVSTALWPQQKGGCLPNRADGAALLDLLGDLERLDKLLLGAGGNGLLDEERDAGEALEDLQLNVASALRRAAEHRGRADDKRARGHVRRRVLDELVERPEHLRALVRAAHERLALLREHGLGALDGGVDDRDDLQAGPELAACGGRGQHRGRGRADQGRTHCSKRNEWFHGPSSDPGTRRESGVAGGENAYTHRT